MVNRTEGRNRGRKSFDHIINKEYNEIVEGIKISYAGVALDINHIYGNNSATAQFVGKGKILRIINTDVAIQYIKFGDSSITAPTITDGAGLEIGKETYFNTGDNEYFRTSNNAVQIVGLLDR